VDKLLDSVIKYASIPFEFGKMDCAIFVGNIAKDLYNIPTVDTFKNKYSTVKEAKQWLQNNNYVDLKDAVTDILNQSPVTVDRLKDGDIVLKNVKYNTFNQALGIVYKDYGFFIKENKHTLGRIPLSRCECGWNING
jgi:hypothetical protein